MTSKQNAHPACSVAQVIQHLRPGGIETMALDLANATPDKDATCLISLEGDRHNALLHWPRLNTFDGHLTFLNKGQGWKPSLILKLYKLFKKNGVRAVHTHHIGPLLYAGIAARLANIDTIIHTEHDGWHLTAPRRRLLQKLVIRLVKPVLVADAKLVARNMEKYLGLSPDHVIYNGIDISRFCPGDRTAARQAMNLPLDKKVIGCAGRLEWVKGQDLLIDALSAMPRNIHLALAGDGSQRQALMQKAKQLGLADRIHFLGLVEDMPNFYRALDVFSLPSRAEGYPLSSLEAQACGIPTAVTDVGGARESLCPLTGTLLHPESPAHMAKALAWCCYANLRITPRDFVEECGDARRMHAAYAQLRGGI
ncbi:glycosyltransferase [Alteromonas sediminis]|uniref:Glycosyltransferase n=2 Tax=Alteromonas sediminis TaxID=2259342 RepID=A0A3N5Y699_9ALTE|nr:glycosyltransferase [Alteromonas sediminis]